MVSLSINGENSNGENDFGANDWLVEEMYEQYKVNPDSVDKEWWPILERYHQTQGSTPTPAAVSAPAAQVSAPAAPATAPMVAKTTRIEPKAQPIPAQAPVTESITTIEAAEEEAVEDQINVLKGMSKALASNMDAVTPLIFMTQFLIVLMFAISWLSRKWGRVQAWIAGAPAVVFFGGVWASQIIQLLPNLL